MFAGIPACLRSVCAVICLRMFTHVYATFTQCLRNVYAMFTQICFCLHNAVICVNIATFFTCLRMFTHVYACLRMFTQTLRKRNYVYAVFTHVYACLRRLRTGQLADVCSTSSPDSMANCSLLLSFCCDARGARLHGLHDVYIGG